MHVKDRVHGWGNPSENEVHRLHFPEKWFVEQIRTILVKTPLTNPRTHSQTYSIYEPFIRLTTGHYKHRNRGWTGREEKYSISIVPNIVKKATSEEAERNWGN
ncbi:hypothetical protein NPIL_176761 [Nephila pilipes]|uniref:Uncharacterized protein n=1 Tax=Nephila pilipes TaxID=299642 RepID=A0A8X6QB04_NEPPI|nr:hypothetical protein NPIL_176761 [Nephila pilipes]